MTTRSTAHSSRPIEVSVGNGQDEWYKPGKSISEFHASGADVRVLIGGRGSGKTTGVAVEAVTKCIEEAGYRVLALRETQVSNEDTSVGTFNQTYEKMGLLITDDEETSLFRKWDGGLTVRIPSTRAIEMYNEFKTKPRTKAEMRAWIENIGDKWCSWILFRGLKDENRAQNQLRGFECSMMIFIEADLLRESDMDLAVACLRWKRPDGTPFDKYPHILDTNPPGPSHWIAKMEEDSKDDPSVKFWHITTYENQHNMPPGYVQRLERQYRKKPAHWKKFILGQYADVYDGSPVYHAYHEELHAFDDVPWPIGAYLIRGWDFGATHATIFSAYFRLDYQVGKKTIPVEYWWDLAEYYCEQSDVDQQCRAVKNLTEMHFPFWNNRAICSGVYDYCDPAGAQMSDKGSSVNVLYSHHFRPQWQTRVRSLDTTIAVINRLLDERDPLGRPTYRIDKKWCPRLSAAMAGQYRWPKEGEAGYASGEPIKGPKANGADHLSDAARYPKINMLRLAQTVFQELEAPVGQMSKRAKPLNRPKQYY